MKGSVTALVVGCLALGLMACGGGGSSTSEEPSSASAVESAQLEELKLEKEKAEFEAQTAKAEAKSEAREAAKQAARRVQRKAARSAAKAQAAVEQSPESEPEEVPEVIGLRLPQARSALSAAGYTTRAENTDTAFGIVVPSHYTVCEQGEPQNNVVTVLAQKYGC